MRPKVAVTSLIAAFALAGAFTGCPPSTSRDGGTEDGGALLSPVELCGRLAAARCELIRRCYAAFERLTPEDCQSIQSSRCLAQYEAHRGAIDAGTLVIDSAAAISCEERMASSSCVASFPPGYRSASMARPFSDCEIGALLKGKVGPGGPCGDPFECSGSFCVKYRGTCTGVCSIRPGAGEPCAFGCAAGTYCETMANSDYTDDRCQPLKAVSQPCLETKECTPDAFCRDGKICVEVAQAGQPCVLDRARVSTCAPGLACDLMPYASKVGVCTAPKGAGEPCKYHWTCASGLVCGNMDLDNFPNVEPVRSGTCQPRAGLGEGCQYSQYSAYIGDTCAPGLTCRPRPVDGGPPSAGVCEKLPNLGDPCRATAQDCTGLEVYCKPDGPNSEIGTCTGPADPGDRCAFKIDPSNTVSIPCTQGFCDSGKSLVCLAPNKGLGQVCTSDGECLSNRCAVQEDSTLKCAEACN